MSRGRKKATRQKKSLPQAEEKASGEISSQAQKEATILCLYLREIVGWGQTAEAFYFALNYGSEAETVAAFEEWAAQAFRVERAEKAYCLASGKAEATDTETIH
jgi:hypothetical protein